MQLSEVSCSAHKQTKRPTQKLELRPLTEHTVYAETDKMDESTERGRVATEHGARVFATDVLKWRYDLHEL